MKGQRFKSSRKVSQKMKNAGIDISHTSVQKAAHASGLKPFRRVRKPALSKQQRKDRVKFARDNKYRDWSKVMFVDEKAFHLLPLPNRKNDVVWEDTSEEVPPQPSTHTTAKINVFAGISMNGKTDLHIFEENLTGQLYKSILEDFLYMPSS